MDLSLPIGNNSVSLEDCLNLFFQEEELTDIYYCDTCKRKSKAKRLIRISKTPKILVIHLKRFKMFPKKKKITDFISFPLNKFDISKYFSTYIIINN